jgi:hypothetical protein
MFAVGASAVSDEPVMFCIEPQWVLNPPDSNIAPHLSLPHRCSVGSRNVFRPTRPEAVVLLYGSQLARIVCDPGVGRLDQPHIIIFRHWRLHRPTVR